MARAARSRRGAVGPSRSLAARGCARAVVAVRRRARLRRRVVGRGPRALRRETREAYDGGAGAKRMRVVRAGHGVARLACDRSCARRRRVRGMRAGARPGTVAGSVTRAAASASVSEIDLSVHVQRRRGQRRARGIGLAVTARARAGEVRLRRRRMARVAVEGCAARAPRRSGKRASAIVARAGTSPRSAVEPSLASGGGMVEPHLHVAVGVGAREIPERRTRVARRAVEARCA
ncbi:MAG: hypothetical protein JWP87_2058 [Labilithrix sp.]|nr:hypothetical protein [Labilithrix sp.]